MTASWTVFLALLAAAVLALVAVVAARRRALRVEAIEHKTDLHTWESEGGSSVRAARRKPPS